MQDLYERHGKKLGEARFALTLADGQALRLFRRKAPPTEAELAALQARYDEASAALSPWDGADTKGRAEAQIATLLLRRHQQAKGAKTAEAASLLTEVVPHLRYAQLLASPIEAGLVQGMEIYVSRERLSPTDKLASPVLDTSKVPAGVGRRFLSCELAKAARLAKDNAAYSRYAQTAAGDPVPDVVAADRPRLLPSLGVDGHLRVTARGSDSIVVLPRCSLK